MSCLGNFTYVLWVWQSNCSIPTVHPCILRNCGGITVASFHILNVAYNNVLRRLLRRQRFCSASGLFAECRIPSCKAVICKMIFRFMTRLDLSKNSIVSTEYQSWWKLVDANRKLLTWESNFTLWVIDLNTISWSTILVSDIRWTSRIRRHWVKSLYVHHNLVW